MISSVREYGNRPFRVVVLHGGPGAPGYMAPVARGLSAYFGVLEPLQTRDSLDSQVDELNEQLSNHADLPVTLVGSSWGAVLALCLASRHRGAVKKLILVGCAVFDAHHSAMIGPRRMERLSIDSRERARAIENSMRDANAKTRDLLFKEWAELLFDADVYDPLTRDLEVIEVQSELHARVWADFVALRDNPGKLARGFSAIQEPVAVIHGEHDPHPIGGIRPFLESCLPDTTFYILSKCGHYPWIERHARERFFEILVTTIEQSN